MDELRKPLGDMGGWPFRLFLVGMAILVFMMLVACGSSSSEPAPAPTREPTATSAPTAAVEPAASECPNIAQQFYFLQAAEETVFIGTSFGGLVVIFTEGGEDPTVITTERWSLEVVEQLSILEQGAAGIRELDPPPGTEEIQAVLQRTAWRLDDLVEALTLGLDNNDVAEI